MREFEVPIASMVTYLASSSYDEERAGRGRTEGHDGRLTQRHWSDRCLREEPVALHYAFAELRYSGDVWVDVAASMGIKMNDVVEEDGFAQLVRRRWELAIRDGKLIGRQEGRQEGQAAVLQAAKTVLSSADFERLKQALDESTSS